MKWLEQNKAKVKLREVEQQFWSNLKLGSYLKINDCLSLNYQLGPQNL